MKYIFIALALPLFIAGAVVGMAFWILAIGFMAARELVDEIIW